MVGIRGVEFFTALFPNGGVYLLPLKAAVRKRLGATTGDLIVGALRVGRV